MRLREENHHFSRAYKSCKLYLKSYKQSALLTYLISLSPCFYPYRSVSKTIIAFPFIISHNRVTTWGSRLITRFLCADKKSVRQEGYCNSRKIAPGSNTTAVSRLKERLKEGYSRQIRGFKQFQDSAARTRMKTPDRIQGSQRPRRESKYKPEVHSDLAIKGGQIQLTILFYFVIFIV
jgi:hypothetical protein